jgi:L-aspartate oxidase
MKLLAPKPGWIVSSDVIVIGSGVAGLTAALNAHAAGLTVRIVTKARMDEGSTKWAQGGIAAAVGPGDTPAEHMSDTLIAGAGLCDEAAVYKLVTEGPVAIANLIDRGAKFDKSKDGEISLTREGGHHRNRILHAGGDATGAEVSRALLAKLAETDGIELIEHALVLDAVKNSDGRVCGVTVHVMGEGKVDGVGLALAKAVVIATGGLGQVYSQTTNPSVSTGDGVALALRAGATVADVEFIQFHPTVLWRDTPQGAKGQQPLISEAVRGEGAKLYNQRGERFMVGRHELAELAPRDVVAKEIFNQMRQSASPHVWLDASEIGDFPERFPTIYQSCLENGIDPTKQMIPVAPASHYASGGIQVDLNGKTSVPGMYACGETACTGAHGANRLASNSLLEGLVFGAAIAEDISKSAGQIPTPRVEDLEIMPDEPMLLLDPAIRMALQLAMSQGAGVMRTAQSLQETLKTLQQLGKRRSTKPATASWEVTNLHLLATAIVKAALARQESRGSHWRSDFPDSSSEFLVRIVQALDSTGNWQTDQVALVGKRVSEQA